MKKQMSLFIWAVAVFGMAPLWAATNSGMGGASSADLTGAPGTRARQNVNYEKYETRTTTKTYATKDGGDIYYTAPQKRSAAYQNYQPAQQNAYSSSSAVRSENVRTSRTETARREAKRKYYLAHPFFQPLKGKFGSVTDLSYSASSYDIATNFDLTTFPTLVDDTGKWDMKRTSVKEDFSYGISDKLAVIAMLQYDSSKFAFDWDNSPDDSMKDSGINLYGLGLQWRFTDNADWIATLSGYFQHQKDIANNYIIDLKAGYKVGTSTIYGLARGWYVDFDGTSYGNGITNGDEQMFLAYKTDVSNAFYIEGGAGVFSVIDEDWTLNAELILGNYDWHTQASIKGAIGWQPGESFALNLYAKTAIYDDADGKDLDFYSISPTHGISDWTKIGTARIDNYAEWTIGLQAILYF